MKIPKYWKHVTIEEITLDSKNGKTGRPSDIPPGVPRLGITSITSSMNDYVVEEYKYQNVSSSDLQKYSIENGDLLICRQNGNKSYVGKSAVYGGKTSPLIFSDSLIRFRLNTKIILPQYLALFLNSKDGRDQLERWCTTTAGNFSINGTNILKIELDIPTLDEQTRIVQNLDYMRMKIQEIKETKKNAMMELSYIIPSVLAHIFNDRLETNSELIRLDQCFKLVNSGSTPKKIRGNYVLQDGIPFIKANYITNDGRVIVNDGNPMINRNLHEGEMKRSQVTGNCILVNIVGPPLGKVGLIDGSVKEANINQAIVALREPLNCIPEYVWYCLRSPLYNSRLIDLGIGIRQHNINTSQIREFRIPIPSKDEQKKIVRYLNNIRHLVENLIDAQNKTRDEIDTISHSIVYKVLNGDLIW